MQAPLTRKFILNKNCRHCGIKYSQKHIENIFGKDSAPTTLGYCSASCYTKSLTGGGAKIPNNTNECKKEFSIPFNYEAQKTDKGNWVLPIEILGKGKVAQTYGETKKECEANAQHIIKSVNMHEELVEGIRRLMNELIYSISNQCKVLVMADDQIIDTINKNSLVIKYRELLKQAEKK